MTPSKTSNIITNQTSRLSVQVSLTGLSFLVVSGSREISHFRKCEFDYALAPEELHWELEKEINNNLSLQVKPEEMEVFHASNLYTIVPASLFDESRASDYLKFNTKILQNDYIGFDELKHHELVVVYLPYISANNFLFEKYGGFNYYHVITKLLDHFLHVEKYTLNTKVYLHVQKGYFDCIIIKNGALLLCNSYTYKTPEDFAYFVLFCFEQLKLNPNEVPTILCGDIHATGDLFDILYTYIREVSFYEGKLPDIEGLSRHESIALKTSY